MNAKALSDVKVIEYGDFISGPFCTKFLADLGAEVIKIEEPGCADSARRTGPFLDDTPHPERSGLFLYLNTNKLGITLDLKSATGAMIFKQLVKTADILVENKPPSVMKKLGLDYETLSQINTGLVMTSIKPFGEDGPYAHFKGNDLICGQMSGLAYHTPMGGVENPEESPPLTPGGRQSEFIAGNTAAVATMFAFTARQRNGGEGQFVDVSQQESIASFLRHQITFYSYDPEGMYQKWYGSREIRLRGLGYLPCKDGHIVNGCREEYHWRALLELAIGPDWEQVEEYRDLFSDGFNLFTFLDHFLTIRPFILKWTMQHTKEEITALAQAKSIPITPANSAEDILNSTQFSARGFFTDINHPRAGTLRYPGAPYKLSGTPWQIETPAPLLGQHNEQILCGRLGYSKEDLVKLYQMGII